MTGSRARTYTREIAGALAGLIVWLACEPVLTTVSVPAGFYVTAFAYVFGAGGVVLLPWERRIPFAERILLACAIGMAIAPNAIALLSVCHAGSLSGPCAFALSGVVA